MKNIVWTILLAGLSCSLNAQVGLRTPKSLSDTARISLLTGSAGRDLYSIFGHSAVHIYDPLNRMDRCYNYGTFDLDQPNFYVKFMRGKLLYFLNPEPYKALVYGYSIEQRNLEEQVLNLNDSLKQRLFVLLQDNLKKENRYYLYDFFYDNCSTRIRDILKTLFDGKLEYNYDGLPIGMTMRELLHSKLGTIPWTRFGMDLLLGQPTDKVAEPDDFMFLPDYLHDVIGKTNMPDGRPLVSREWITPDVPYPPPNDKPPFWMTPMAILWGLAILLGTVYVLFERFRRWIENVLAVILGFSGTLMLFMWFGTDHVTTKDNWNVLWALPTHLILGFTMLRRYHWIFAGGVAFLVFLGQFLIPQDMPNEVIPIMLLVALIGLYNAGWRMPFRRKKVEEEAAA
jgi:hypothetical protein